MTLDEAIKHSEERSGTETVCRQEHAQLAEWLKELKRLREAQMKRDRNASARFKGLLA